MIWQEKAHLPAAVEGFNFSQQDIFNGIFTNQAFYEELNRIFNQAGLDSTVISSGKHFPMEIRFQVLFNVKRSNTSYNFNSASSKTSSYKPGMEQYDRGYSAGLHDLY